MSWNADTIVKKSTPPSKVKERPAAPGKMKTISDNIDTSSWETVGSSKVKTVSSKVKERTAMSDNKIDTSSWETVGRNLRFATIDGTLFIAVPIDEKSIKGAPVSATGKSKVIGSTLGNVSVTGSEIKFGVNVYTKV